MASVSYVRGVWRALVRVKGHRPISQSFPTEAEANEWGADKEREIRNGLKPPTREDTIGVLAQKMLDEIKAMGGEPKPGLAYGMSMLISTKTESPVADVPLGRLTRDAVVAFCTSPTITNGQQATRATVQYRLTWLTRLLKHCTNVWGFAVPNVLPAARAAMKTSGRLGKANQRKRRVSPDELEKMCEAISARPWPKLQTHECNYADVFRLACLQTFRRGEIAKLAWANIDLEKQTVLIEDRKDPQNKDGNDNYAPILDEAIEILRRQPRVGERVFMPCDCPDTSAELFTRAWAWARKKCGLSNVRMHDLRHEGISTLIESGESEATVRLFSGHKTGRMLERYTHLRAEKVLANRANRLKQAAAKPANSEQEAIAAAMQALAKMGMLKVPTDA